MPKAIVFFDLDLTLLDDSKRVPPENAKSIKRLQENDILPVICTGKNRWEVDKISNETGINTLICANGADLFINGQHTFQNPIGRPQLSRLLTAAKSADLPVAMFNERHVALTEGNHNTHANFKMMAQVHPEVIPTFNQQESVCMCLLFTPQTFEGEQIGDEFRKKFPEFTFYRNGPYALDVVNRGMTKGTGIDLLLSYSQYNELPTYAFGDGNNDIAMFKRVDTAIAMGNALPQVASVANYQTDDYQHNGIPNALSHFGLI